MRLAISNIAWDTTEDSSVARLLQQYGIDAIDVAPGKYFSEPDTATVKDIALVKQWWAARGVEITGMQALLFGTAGLNLFGTPGVQDSMLARLTAVCRIGAGLGARRLVFGSPKNRDRSGLSDAEATRKAVPFFRRLGDIAAVHGVTICLEPNPPCYGANFMTTSAETARVVAKVAHPAIRMQLDTGALTINGEAPAAVLRDSADLIGHIHASEPDLVPLGDGLTDHAKVVEALTPRFRDFVVTIEMLATKDEPHLVSIERALGVAIRHYRDSDRRQTA
jgi:sugar phosphate isomerase/epimerase